MKAAAFEVVAPENLAAAFVASARDGGRIIAGGQSLGPMLNLRVARPQILVPVARLADLGGAGEDSEAVTLGAAVTHAEIEDGRTPDLPGGILARIASGIAYRAVRNRGTIGGSLCHADPAADWVTTLIALRARVVVAGPGGRREESADRFVLGAYRTALAPGELVCAVRIPKPAPGARFGYFKFCRKPGEFAHAMAAVLLEGPRRRAAIGATGGAPIVLEGETIAPESLARAGLEGAALATQTAALARALRQAEGSA
jgi:carbon-monoxide dehydrogenase medium subunit